MKFEQFRWIIDAHNLILTHYNPTEDRSPDRATHAEIRRELEDAVEQFAERHQLRACLVYDGIHLATGNPGAKKGIRLEVIYADPPAEADDLIWQKAEQWSRDGGLPPAVVTSDRRSLVPRLAGARVVGSPEFFRMLQETIGQRPAPGGERSDPELERIFLAREETNLPRKKVTPLTPPVRTTDTVTRRSRLEFKRERGKRKQKRRLEWQRRK